MVLYTFQILIHLEKIPSLLEIINFTWRWSLIVYLAEKNGIEDYVACYSAIKRKNNALHKSYLT
jgi:hypothetical protein